MENKQGKSGKTLTIAVDPDCEKSGWAAWDGSAMRAECLRFPVLIDRCRQEAASFGGECRVVVEAGWLNDSHWHVPASKGGAYAAALGNSVGRNHQTARLIAECLRYHGLPVEEVKPLRKFWQGRDRKITQEELNRQLALRGAEPLKRCSQDARDAALLALAYHR